MNCIVYFVSTTLYSQIFPHKAQVESSSRKPIQRKTMLFSVHFRKPPIPAHYEIIAQVYTNCIYIFLTDLIIPIFGGIAHLRAHPTKS